MTKKHHFTNITANKIIHQILVNEKVKRMKKNNKNNITLRTQQENDFLKKPFTIDELNCAIKS